MHLDRHHDTDMAPPIARKAAGRVLDPASVRDVLVMRALPGLGEFLCVTPALRALRAALPRACITLLGLPETRGLVARYPHLVDQFLEFPGFPGLPGAPVDVTALPGFLRAVQGRFDLAIQMHGDGTISNTFVQLLGARRTAGFHAPALPCPDPLSFVTHPRDLPEPLVWLALLRFLGAPTQGQQLDFPVGPGDAAEVDALLCAAEVAPGARLAVLHAGAPDPRRRLDPRVLAGVADGLAARGLRVVLTGGADEQPIAAAARSRAGCAPIDLAGRTSLGALAALIGRAQIVVAGDTGVSHLASALRAASVVLLLAGDAQRSAPIDRARHRVIDFTATPPGADAILLEVDAVLAAARPGAPDLAATPRDVRGARRLLVMPVMPLMPDMPVMPLMPLMPGMPLMPLMPPAGGPGALEPALRRLRVALPDATLVLLADGPYDARLVDEVVPGAALIDLDVAALPALIERLAAARLDAAIVFTAEGESAFEAAYIAYLAGIPLRAGLGEEFGGGVLSSAVRPPPRSVRASERHLFLLDELGL